MTLGHGVLVAGLHFLRVVVFEVLEEVEALAQVACRPLDPEFGVDQEDVPYGELQWHVSSARKLATQYNITSPISSCTTR